MKFIKYLVIFTLFCIVLGAGTIFGFYKYVESDLPDVAELKDVQLQTPMQVFSQDRKLIAQFGEKRRIPVHLDQMPPQLLHAFIATEDTRFYEHFGFDPIGIARAAFAVIASGSASQGASTITQQLARNFFLSNEKKIMRKIKEIFIAVHIEQLLSKDEILELYLNKIYLGYRSYGVGAAAQSYFGKELNQLSLSEMAMIAGLPKAPSRLNPIYSVERATHRRNVVLGRMLDEGYITQDQYAQARKEVLVAKYHGAEIEVDAPYVAELARAWMVEHYGEDAYTSGMRVVTTIKADLQEAANHAAITNLLNYDMRHGYRGAEQLIWQPGDVAFTPKQMDEVLDNLPTYGALTPAIVTQVDQQKASVWVKGLGLKTIDWDGMKWARQYKTDKRQGTAPKTAGDILATGEQVWVRLNGDVGDSEGEAWLLSQVPAANTAFVALNPEKGAVLSLVGGFNFIHSKFNRATMSVRQVGSGIKPFIYAAALDQGLTLSTLINDAPINHWDASMGTAWRPKNSPPTYYGPTRMRIGLAQSKNVMAVRVLREVGIDNARHYLARFGFDLDNLPHSETLALGAGSLTPIKLAQGYSVFANGGYYVEPYYIERVEDPYGAIKYQAAPKIVCQDNCDDTINYFEDNQNSMYAPRVITTQNAFLARELLYSNVWGGGDWSEGTGWNGTGWRAQALKRRDIGGKTGTTNDAKDAWYNGFGPGIVATTWIGFDTHDRNLGRTSRNKNLGKDQTSGGESGGKTAQPAWVEFMQTALNNVPEHDKVIPKGIIRVRIDRESGLLTEDTGANTMFEYYREGTEPTEYSSSGANSIYTSENGEEELF